MKRSYHNTICFLVLCFIMQVNGQEVKGDVVFAGENFIEKMHIGSLDLAILLMENGAFSESLDASNWQTKVEGRDKKVSEGNLAALRDKTILRNIENGSSNLTKEQTSDTAILEKIKIAHGGSAIDSIATVEAITETSEIEFKVRIDIKRKFLRLESLSPSISYIEQIEDETGWIYQSGEIQEMPDNRVAEMRNTFYSGLFLLQTPMLNRIKVLAVKDNGNGFKVLKLDLDGTISGMVMDALTNRLVGTAKFNALGSEITYLSDFREVNGSLIPFKEEVETDGQNVLIQNSSYTINPVWDINVWERPK